MYINTVKEKKLISFSLFYLFNIYRAHHDRESGDYAGSISDIQSVTSRLSTVSVSFSFFFFSINLILL